MKILVTGAEGMVGSSLLPVLRARGHDVVPTDLRPIEPATLALDICQADVVLQTFDRTQPDLVMHLAAETDVDRCELEPAHGYRCNAAGTEHIAAACRRLGARLLYMSTAGVFDGRKPAPYIESDEPNPANVYGRTKLAGEHAVRQSGVPWRIVRASWMIGGLDRDKKFVAKILKLLETENTLRVVTDKRGSLTFTTDLAEGLAALIQSDHLGLFHMANAGACTRHDVASEIVRLLGRADVRVEPITSDAFPLPAPRAASEVLENRRLHELGLDRMPPWQTALARYVDRYRATVQECAPSS